MKSIAILILILFTTSFPTSSHAAPLYRVWRGYKLASLTREQFRSGINQKLIPATVETGAGKGLIAYLPALTGATATPHIPDEVALVVYRNQAEYDAIRATPAGQSYANLHWDFFDREGGSKSLVPTPWQGQLENEKAYDVLLSEANWQHGVVVYSLSKKVGNVSAYIDQMKNDSSNSGLLSYVVLNSETYLIEYQLWKDATSFKNFQKKMDMNSSKVLDRFEGGMATNQDPFDSELDFGHAVNTQFDSERMIIK